MWETETSVDIQRNPLPSVNPLVAKQISGSNLTNLVQTEHFAKISQTGWTELLKKFAHLCSLWQAIIKHLELYNGILR